MLYPSSRYTEQLSSLGACNVPPHLSRSHQVAINEAVIRFTTTESDLQYMELQKLASYSHLVANASCLYNGLDRLITPAGGATYSLVHTKHAYLGKS